MASALNSGPRGRVFALIKLYALLPRRSACMASALNSGPRGRVFALIKLYALYIPFLYRGVARAWQARLIRDQEVACSP